MGAMGPLRKAPSRPWGAPTNFVYATQVTRLHPAVGRAHAPDAGIIRAPNASGM